MKEFYLKFPSVLENLEFAEEIWQKFLRENKLDKESIYWISLSIHEIVSNAIIHGNKGDGNKWVEVMIKDKGDYIKVEVIDEGSCEEIPKVLKPEEKGNIYKNHGRGLFIVKSIVSLLKFKILPNKNLKVIMKFRKELCQK